MPLPLPNLDDKTFALFVEEATHILPRYAPEWTDHNRHDPGITFIELFAWLAEMQQYYLQQIRPDNYRKFLKLLGVTPQDALPARAEVTFTLAPATTTTITVPPGSKLGAGAVVFETDTALLVVPNTLIQVLSASRVGVQDNTAAQQRQGLSFFAFGVEAEAGSRLYLGFDTPFPPGKTLSLTFALFEAYPVARGVHGNEPEEVVPSVRLAWEYFSAQRTWTALDVQHDTTEMLARSGRLSFTTPGDMVQRTIPPFTTTLYWLRATVQEAGYELPPQVDTIVLNTTSVVQCDTLSAMLTFSSDGQANQKFQASTYLALTGSTVVQIREADGRWQDWEQRQSLATSGPHDPHYTLEQNAATRQLALTFGDGQHGQIPAAGEANVRLVAYLPTFEARRWLGRSNGLPGQTFTLERTPAVRDSVLLQVAEEIRNGSQVVGIRWRDWLCRDDFDASGPGDPHYVLDPATGTVIFGDGVHGDVPPVANAAQRPNIRVIAYQVGGGERGNISAGIITQWVQPVSGLTTVTIVPRGAATGGTEPETLEQAQLRARQDLKTPFQAVTSADFEFLARTTPGLRVARAKAIPLFAPGMQQYPLTQAPATVTVVVVPYSLSPRPTPSHGFILTVCRHLDKHRLITTKPYVIPPDYVQVSVQGAVLLQAGFDPTPTRQRLEAALNTFLDPLQGGPEGTGWPFGRPVYTSEVYQALERVPGVDCVERVLLSAVGAGSSRTAEGHIVISPHSLVYAGTHQIEVLSSTPMCRV